MKSIHLIAGMALTGLLLAGCGKKDDPAAGAPATDPAAEQAAQAAPPPPPDDSAAIAAQAAREQQQIAQEIPLNEVSQAVQKGQYEGAVNTLGNLGGSAQYMSDEDRARYYQALRATTEALMRAKETDPAAKAAYQRLSRQTLGR